MSKNEVKSLLAAVYYTMMVDDKVTNEERAFFSNLCKEKGLNQNEVSDIVNNNSRLSQQVPLKKHKKEIFFEELVSIALADGVIAPDELSHLEKYAAMMGLADSSDNIKALIEDIIKKKKSSQ